MRDRLSTKILSNGATRYGVYDETGNLLRYEYIKLEDEPTVEGDLFSKANMLPDSIPAALGLKMGNPQVKDALNVLANIGNVHVWQRVQTYADPVPEVPAGYTLGEAEENVVLASRKTTISTKGTFYYYYGDSVTVKNDGTVNAPSSDSWATIGRNVSATTLKSGPLFVKGSSSYISSGSGYQDADVTNEATKVFYIPSGGTLSVTVDSNAKMCYVVATKYQPVIGYPYTPAIPAGTHVDYLTSTDPDAYPDNVTDAQDAHYTVGDVVTGKFGMGMRYASSDYIYSVASEISVADDGTISLKNPSEFRIGGSGGTPGVASDVTTAIAGKYIQMTQQGSREDQMTGPFSTAPSAVLYIPSDVVATREEIGSGNTYTWYFIDRYQPVTGHAAIPANTTITYLGQLGESGARIEVGSYVGTGTYGADNPNSLTFGFEPKLVAIFAPAKNGNYAGKMFMLRNVLGASILDSDGNNCGVIVTWSEKSVSWHTYSGSAGRDSYQMNYSGYTYHYIALG